MKRSEFLKTEGGRLFAQLEAAVRRCLYVPNHLLPEDFQDQRTDSVSLAALEKKCEARELQTNHAYEKAEKEKRIRMYTRQIELGREIIYLPK
jgi:hypothetical protein